MARTIIVKPLGLVLQKAGLVSPEQVKIALKALVSLPNCKIGEIMANKGWINQQTADFFAEQWPKLLTRKQQQPLGQYLKAAGLIDQSQIIAILLEQTDSGLKFGASAVIKGLISQTTLDFFLEQLELIKIRSRSKKRSLPSEQPEHLSLVENYLLYNQKCEPIVLLKLYQQIWQQTEITATNSEAEAQLIQSGLVVRQEDKLKLPPSLDRYSFNQNWIEQQLISLQPYNKIRLKLFGLETKASSPYKILAEVNFWTNAQPFLTQKLYQIIRDRESFIPRGQESARIADLVHKYIIDHWETKSAASHLFKLRSDILESPICSVVSLLTVYREVWERAQISLDHNPEKAYLLKIGLIKLEQDKIRVANHIYYTIFDRIWIEEQLAIAHGSMTTLSVRDNITTFLTENNPNRPDVTNNDSYKIAPKIPLVILLGSSIWLGFNSVIKYIQIQQFQKANQLLTKKNYQQAVTAYEQLLQTNLAKSDRVWINRGYALGGLKKYEAMLQSCSSATLIEPQSALGWNCQGETLYHLERYQAALRAFEQATETNPQEATFWLNKSKSLSKLKEYQAANIASEQAIKLIEQQAGSNQANNHSNLALAYNQKGQSLLQEDQYQQALAAFEQSLKYNPDYLSAQQGKGIALYESGSYKQAAEVFANILTKDDLSELSEPQKAMNWLYKGISLCHTPELSAADQAFQQVLVLNSDRQVNAIAKAGCGIK
jgi:tetratricopeptide (TPR) repeat protein